MPLQRCWVAVAQGHSPAPGTQYPHTPLQQVRARMAGWPYPPCKDDQRPSNVLRSLPPLPAQGPVFESDTRRPQGPVLTWVDKLLAVAVEGPQQVGWWW